MSLEPKSPRIWRPAGVVWMVLALACSHRVSTGAPDAGPQADAGVATDSGILDGGVDAGPNTSTPDQGEEFVGPFPSWANLRSAYAAVGDGAADDTAAIQKALA